MAKPNALILRAPGTNCDVETAYAFELAGGMAERIHVNELLEKPDALERFQILCVPGGFSYGDDVAAGKILAAKFQHRLLEPLAEFHASGKLMLGICNGFQVLLKTGLMFEDPSGTPDATLTWNDHGRYEARWVTVEVESDRCVFLRGISSMYLPMAHAEGKFMARDAATLERIRHNGQLPLRYTVESVSRASARKLVGAASASRSSAGHSDSPVPFPFNPSGSQEAVAGFCDPTGRAFGLMPHPERFVQPTQHPRWTRDGLQREGDGLQIFRNAVEFFG
jgi:phosphoribosylformylglycinamidine synthase